jgi:hypothetical protein
VTARAFLAALRNGRSNYAGTTVPLERRLRRLSGLEQKEEARAFLTLFYQESGRTKSALGKRWAEVRRSLSKTGTYEHTQQELAYGARVAWRNHGRCIGRLYWESLEVFDCRELTEPESILDRMVQHMRDSLGEGRIRSMISVFAPVRSSTLPAYIESDQSLSMRDISSPMAQFWETARMLRPHGSLLRLGSELPIRDAGSTCSQSL